MSNRQFFALSKAHHPDHNPNDPSASERFVNISKAYAILGNPEKREQYDRENQRVQGAPVQDMGHGSHSSSSTPYGSRPASGLSRRRTQFRGPPPSFYQNGGWGSHGRRRKSQAEGTSRGETDPSANGGRGGGFSPGQGQAGFNQDVSHFDQDGHYRTQEQQDLRRKRRLRDEGGDNIENNGILLRFVMVGSVLTFAFSFPIWNYRVTGIPPRVNTQT